MEKKIVTGVVFFLAFICLASPSHAADPFPVRGKVIQVGTKTVGTEHGVPYVYIRKENNTNWPPPLAVNGRNEMYIVALTALATGDTVVGTYDPDAKVWLNIYIEVEQ